ncbi:hypothetical protein P280DRAFT_511938 [Massarina eburnea CBS 473.64]|uniref:Zn(2)-C6 fungal-type domain-containing protein n=1 Tax=Massarina eburnea CBS 473.64 TaxID=1395130 RepID=A0A6A6RIX3_9PLEO|nr:hypothetical protein P280DRAFT_511938 [Massarina eburnea CBS 473.64]
MAPSSTSSFPPSRLTPDTTPPAQHHHQIQKPFSCVLCAQRKVKCDKAPGGCSNCTKARVDCVYKAPAPPRRRRKGRRDVDVHARLRIYEDALRELGVEPEELVSRELEKQKKSLGVGKLGLAEDVLAAEGEGKTEGSKGVLVSGEGKSRYLENALWTSLKGEFRDSREILEDSDEEESERGGGGRTTPSSTTTLRPLHPQPWQIFKLWQTYLSNINPLLKVFHTPSVQQIISNASGNLDDIPKNVEALLFSIYNISIESLSDAECNAIMGESKIIIGHRFRAATKHALLAANFLKSSDFMVLQAFILFITSLQNYDARVIWILTGVATRIGQRIGLHRDPSTLDLPPFESEMRRRLWWQILLQDGFAEKLAGTGGTVVTTQVKRPSNVNDSDLVPGMKEPPKEHSGATEMMFFLIRIHLAGFLMKSAANKKSKSGPDFDGVWSKLSNHTASLCVKDQAIDDLETMYQNKFLKFCDSSVTWHSMCTFLVKAIIAMLRFIAHNPDTHGAGRESVPQPERDMLFRVAVSITSYQNHAYTTREMQGYLWHINSHFQWKGFIYILSELRYRTEDSDEVRNAWRQVQLVYDFHPNFSREAVRTALPVAVDSLALKAWGRFVEARGVPVEGEPVFIRVLRRRVERREMAAAKAAAAAAEAASATSSSISHKHGLALRDDAGLGPTALPSSSRSSATSIPSNPFVAVAFTTSTAAASFPSLTTTLAHPSSSSSFPATNPDPVQAFQWDPNFAASLDAPSSALDSQVLPNQTLLDPDQMNWANWDELVKDFEMDGGEVDGEGGGDGWLEGLAG